MTAPEGLYWARSGNDYDRHDNTIHNQYELAQKLDVLEAKLDRLLASVRELRLKAEVQLLIKDGEPK